MTFRPRIPPGGKVIQFGKPAAPITKHAGEHWNSALDCLKELVSDIETGRTDAPTMIYVAVQARHPEHPEMVKYPSYCWSEGKSYGLAMVGLLEKHKAKILS